jgi:hypothetical protein
VLRHCFTGEKFSFHGKRYDFDDVVIRPRRGASRQSRGRGGLALQLPS